MCATVLPVYVLLIRNKGKRRSSGVEVPHELQVGEVKVRPYHHGTRWYFKTLQVILGTKKCQGSTEVIPLGIMSESLHKNTVIHPVVDIQQCGPATLGWSTYAVSIKTNSLVHWWKTKLILNYCVIHGNQWGFNIFSYSSLPFPTFYLS